MAEIIDVEQSSSDDNPKQTRKQKETQRGRPKLNLRLQSRPTTKTMILLALQANLKVLVNQTVTVLK